MSHHYIIKRNPGFTQTGVIVKRRQPNKGYSETVITDRSQNPISNRLNPGDTIYVSETGYGVYAVGKVKYVSEILEFATTDDVIDYVVKAEIKDAPYWMDKLKRFREKITVKPKTTLKYQEYFIDQHLLDRTVPLVGVLNRLSKVQSSITLLTDEEVEFLKNPKRSEADHLDPNIPSALRLDVYSLLNKEYNIQHWIDIDHFVPKSVFGPGNIIENLVPVGMSLNRYKSNSIPKGLFQVAETDHRLKEFAKKEFLSTTDDFLRKTNYPGVLDSAMRINQEVAKQFTMNEAREFYRKILKIHLPAYEEMVRKFTTP